MAPYPKIRLPLDMRIFVFAITGLLAIGAAIFGLLYFSLGWDEAAAISIP